MNPSEQAHAFLRGMYEAMAHGDDNHQAWLLSECMRWVKPPTRILEATHQRGFAVGRQVPPRTIEKSS